MPPSTPKAEKPAIELVKFTSWHSGYRAGEVAGFSPDEAAKLIEAGAAERYLTEEQRGKVEAAARKAQEAAEKEAKEAAAKAEAEAKAQKEADEKKAKGGA